MIGAWTIVRPNGPDYHFEAELRLEYRRNGAGELVPVVVGGAWPRELVFELEEGAYVRPSDPWPPREERPA
jgi:hypothetical protein